MNRAACTRYLGSALFALDSRFSTWLLRPYLLADFNGGPLHAQNLEECWRSFCWSRTACHLFRNGRFRPDFAFDSHREARDRLTLYNGSTRTVGKSSQRPLATFVCCLGRMDFVARRGKIPVGFACFIRCASISLSSPSFHRTTLRPVAPTLILCGSHSGARRPISSGICPNGLRTIQRPICRYSRTSPLTRPRLFPNVSMRQPRFLFTRRKITARLETS